MVLLRNWFPPKPTQPRNIVPVAQLHPTVWRYKSSLLTVSCYTLVSLCSPIITCEVYPYNVIVACLYVCMYIFVFCFSFVCVRVHVCCALVFLHMLRKDSSLETFLPCCAPCTLQRVLRPRSTNTSPLCSLHPLADNIHPMSPHTSPTLFRRTVTLANYTLLHCTAVHPLRTVAVPFRATANPPCAMVAPLPSEPSPSFAAKLPAIAAMYAVKLLLVCATTTDMSGACVSPTTPSRSSRPPRC